MKSPYSTASAADRLSENALYERVYEEIKSGQMDVAAQARAIEEGGSDGGAVKSAYIKHRIENLKAEMKVAIELAERAAEKERKQKEDQDFAYRERLRNLVLADAERHGDERELKRLEVESYEAGNVFLKIVLYFAFIFVLLFLLPMFF